MGYVIHHFRNVAVSTETYEMLDRRKARERKRENPQAVEERRAIGILIYSEAEFDHFYSKHCARIPNDPDPFTVLV